MFIVQERLEYFIPRFRNVQQTPVLGVFVCDVKDDMGQSGDIQCI